MLFSEKLSRTALVFCKVPVKGYVFPGDPEDLHQRPDQPADQNLDHRFGRLSQIEITHAADADPVTIHAPLHAVGARYSQGPAYQAEIIIIYPFNPEMIADIRPTQILRMVSPYIVPAHGIAVMGQAVMDDDMAVIHFFSNTIAGVSSML